VDQVVPVAMPFCKAEMHAQVVWVVLLISERVSGPLVTAVVSALAVVPGALAVRSCLPVVMLPAQGRAAVLEGALTYALELRPRLRAAPSRCTVAVAP
jgi:hypothetical protein